MSIFLIRNIISFGALALIAFIALRNKQDKKLNWAMFYSLLYSAISLFLANAYCVEIGLWYFHDSRSLLFMPIDIYFSWVVIWGILPVYFFKGKYPLIIALVLFWLDILLMPQLANYDILTLSSYWYIGESVLLAFVFLPAYLWAKFSYENKHTAFRALMQVITMIAFFIFGLPYLMHEYELINQLQFEWHPYLFQVLLIFAFPGLSAVQDLVIKGKGTPFPYDPTQEIVRTGIYAYIRNPIQWSFAMIFIPMSLYHASYYLLIGTFIAIAYCIGISDPQEYPDMKKRFGEEWSEYKSQVPKWYFQWKPQNIPLGTIYFNLNCTQCTSISQWFHQRNTINLEINPAAEYPHPNITQVSYIDHNGQVFTSVAAIASALEHIHLVYAVLACFMRFPIINHLLQMIVDSMDFAAVPNKEY